VLVRIGIHVQNDPAEQDHTGNNAQGMAMKE
jgi:hypothetical protein